MAPESPDGRDPRRVVADGYDAVAERYLAWSPGRPSATRTAWLQRALAEIPPDAYVLDLGCGAGMPMTQALATDGRRVTGVDISARQIELARANVPSATFLQADMTTMDLPAASLDAVVAFYALTHVPRAEHATLLGRIRGWLRPGGLLLATMGADDSPDEIEDDWLGAPMFFSHFGARTNRALIRRVGFDIQEAVVQAEPEDRHAARFLWVVARTPRPSGPGPGR